MLPRPAVSLALSAILVPLGVSGAMSVYAGSPPPTHAPVISSLKASESKRETVQEVRDRRKSRLRATLDATYACGGIVD